MANFLSHATGGNSHDSDGGLGCETLHLRLWRRTNACSLGTTTARVIGCLLAACVSFRQAFEELTGGGKSLNTQLLHTSYCILHTAYGMRPDSNCTSHVRSNCASTPGKLQKLHSIAWDLGDSPISNLHMARHIQEEGKESGFLQRMTRDSQQLFKMPSKSRSFEATGETRAFLNTNTDQLTPSSSLTETPPGAGPGLGVEPRDPGSGIPTSPDRAYYSTASEASPGGRGIDYLVCACQKPAAKGVNTGPLESASRE
jgi:hypothetical protein